MDPKPLLFESSVKKRLPTESHKKGPKTLFQTPHNSTAKKEPPPTLGFSPQPLSLSLEASVELSPNLSDGKKATTPKLNSNHFPTTGEKLINLLSIIVKGYAKLNQYESSEAIEIFKTLPKSQRQSGWVLSQIAKAHYNLNHYQKAFKLFKKIRKNFSYLLNNMELFSTTLWHLKNLSELSLLAHELLEFDKNRPHGWCALGNCFSLQKENENALRFFQRASSVDKDFVYAYVLIGLEWLNGLY